MSNLQRNLGRGLDDLINEVSKVKAVPAPTAARPAPAPPKNHTVLALSIALVLTALLTAELAWQLYAPRKKFRLSDAGIEVSIAEPLTPMLINKAGAKPITALDWTEDLRAHGVRVERSDSVTRVLFQRPLFLSGTALDPQAPLEHLAQVLLSAANDGEVTVLGHTNNDPMRPGGEYRTSEDLSFARAVAVVNYLRGRGVTMKLKAGVGPAPHPNTDPESKARNRTVTLEIR